MTYLALTIGPIVKTLLQAQKTRELWVASYMLSRLMKHLITELENQGGEVLIPSVPGNIHQKQLYGAGIYPDRLFMKANGFDTTKVEECIENALKRLAVDGLIKKGKQKDSTPNRKKGAADFWKDYFRIRYVLKELDSIENGKLSTELTPYLESMELEDVFFPQTPVYEKNEWNNLFDEKRIYKVRLSNALKRENKGVYQGNMQGLFPSTEEIAALDLLHLKKDKKRKEPDSTHQKNSIGLKIEEEQLAEDDKTPINIPDSDPQSRYRYFCIVQADGDNIGAAVKQLGENDYSVFSKAFSDFGIKAAKTINTYGGKPIYIGGDDLLFLAPLTFTHDDGKVRSILHLIEKLDDEFPSVTLNTYASKAEKEKRKEVSLSYGLNIVYYKFPLFEAIDDSFNQLLSQAKKYPKAKKEKEKNAVAFRLTKHSGSQIGAVFPKAFLAKAVELIDHLNGMQSDSRKGLVSALIFKVKTLEPLLKAMVEPVIQDDALDPEEKENKIQNRIDQFFKSFYDEWGSDQFFENQRVKVAGLLKEAIQVGGIKDGVTLFYSALRLIDFITEPLKSNKHEAKNMPNPA